MTDKKKDNVPSASAITPAGTAIWPKLNTPDTYKGKTTYNVKLAFDADEDSVVNKKAANMRDVAYDLRDEFAEQIRAQLSEQIAEMKASKKGAKAKELQEKLDTLEVMDFGKPEVDEETGEETGRTVIVAKTNATYKDRKGVERERKIDIFDARGKKLDFDSAPQIGGGSTLKLGVTLRPYYMPADNKIGVTSYLDAVQIIDLVSYGGARDASAYGFGEEDGYESEEGNDTGFADESSGGDDANF